MVMNCYVIALLSGTVSNAVVTLLFGTGVTEASSSSFDGPRCGEARRSLQQTIRRKHGPFLVGSSKVAEFGGEVEGEDEVGCDVVNHFEVFMGEKRRHERTEGGESRGQRGFPKAESCGKGVGNTQDHFRVFCSDAC